MPELQEVFRMATQKVDQDDGALERQVTKQRRAARNRQVGAFATVAVFIAIAVAVFALTRGDTGGVPAVSPSIPPVTGGMATGPMVDVHTGKTTRLPRASRRPGTSYAVSPDHTTVAYNACCSSPGPIMAANIDGTQVHPSPRRDGMPTARSGPRTARCSCISNGTPRPSELGNLFVLDVQDRSADAAHELRSDAAVGLVVHVPELRAGLSGPRPLPASERGQR